MASDVIGSGGSGGVGVVGGGCSSDLRSIVDGSGNVLGTCPAAQGCTDGQCVPACDAAAKSGGNLWLPPAWSTISPPCFAVFVANSWPRPARLSLSRDSASFDVTKFARSTANRRPQ